MEVLSRLYLYYSEQKLIKPIKETNFSEKRNVDVKVLKIMQLV